MLFSLLLRVLLFTSIMSSLMVSDKITKNWKCKFCNQLFKSRQSLGGHIKVHKNQEKKNNIAASSSSSSSNFNGNFTNCIIPTHFSDASTMPSFAGFENRSFAVSKDIPVFESSSSNNPFVMHQNHPFSLTYPLSSRFYVNDFSVLNSSNPHAVRYRFFEMEKQTNGGPLPVPSLTLQNHNGAHLTFQRVKRHLLQEVQDDFVQNFAAKRRRVSSTTPVCNEEEETELKELDLLTDPVIIEISSDEEEEEEPDLDVSLHL